jgi:hypothetical protein
MFRRRLGLIIIENYLEKNAATFFQLSGRNASVNPQS